MKREWRARGGALKNPACPHTIVQALPAFIYERGYPIGYLTSRDPRTFLKFNMAVSVDEAIRESLRLFPNVPAVKEKQKKCIELLLKRKDVLGLLPLSRHPRGLGSSTLTLGEPDASLFTDEIRSSYKFRFKSDKNL